MPPTADCESITLTLSFSSNNPLIALNVPEILEEIVIIKTSSPAFV